MFGYSELELFSFWISFGSKGFLFLVLGQNVQLKKNNSIFFKASGDTKKKKKKKTNLIIFGICGPLQIHLKKSSRWLNYTQKNGI